MPRPLRLDFPGAFFHIASRGVERRAIYTDPSDRVAFMKILATACERHGGVAHAYCLMGNHYHLLLESTDGRLSQVMRHLNGSYGRWFNRRHDRNGHLFQGRFRSNLIEHGNYFLEVVRYIELNPCRAGLAPDPADWEWSSYRPRMQEAAVPPFLDVDVVLELLGGERGAYRDFVLSGLAGDRVARRLRQESIVGSREFAAHHAERARKPSHCRKVPTRQTTADRPSLEELLIHLGDPADLRRRAVAAVVKHRYSMTGISRYPGRHDTTISRWVSRSRCDNS